MGEPMCQLDLPAIKWQSFEESKGIAGEAWSEVTAKLGFALLLHRSISCRPRFEDKWSILEEFLKSSCRGEHALGYSISISCRRADGRIDAAG